MKMKKIPLIIISLMIVVSLTGCSYLQDFYVKTGRKNLDFEYIKENKVDRLVIQTTRDKGFRFLVNDIDVIAEIYEILSKAKVVTTKTDLEPDYIFEIHMGEEVKTFYYVTGVNEKDEGNFYNDEKIYKISKRLDNDIIQNLSFIRKPREFQNIYYNSILQTVSSHKDLLIKDNAKVGIDILGDVDLTKYLLSVEMANFQRKLKSIIPNADIINHNRENFDIIVSVRNYGYKTNVYKTIITIENRSENSETKFYIDGVYDGGWEINIYDKKPTDKWK